MKYIRFNTQTKKVVAVCFNKPLVDKNEFISLDGSYAVAEFGGELPKGDYLTVANAQVKTDKWVEKEIEYQEIDLPIEKEVEKSRTYITCDLVANTRQYTAEQLEAIKQRKYEKLVDKYIREKYTANDENKVVREYLADMTNTEKQAQFNEYNTYVESCKARAKQEV